MVEKSTISSKAKGSRRGEEGAREKEADEKKALERKNASAKARLLKALCKGEGTQNEGRPKTKKKKRRPNPPKEPRPRPPDSYELTITRITLRRSDPAYESSFMSYEMKKYPLNNYLYKEKNPLTEACEPDTIRYFHIPAYNMQWIEVHYLPPPAFPHIDRILGSHRSLLW
jgi:hypothetical protein